ncbi:MULTISPECIES: outer membrane-stress sensor serine endopeptidase DegS [Oceanimonas]|uniref:Outer membrane-stress sensor serine endopeptidase DegS n=1 Tax=Oceanimonas doudoroffii TaxID=84158 RepID=A0A233RCT2_9GAMM|nr:MULTISPECIES: outer membrane-stress sensor serine endopeptidase DegS [Oceanimonas]NHI01172.1 Serine endoprotease DegS [Oceanimonas sp. MB9]OXY81181.1 outer membrane-stress sensor serine endopeptidase DegS [Oceanimonas doudoroffii]
MRPATLLKYLFQATLYGVLMAALLLLLFPQLRTQSLEHWWRTPQVGVASFAYAASRAGPAVVNIYTRSFQQGSASPELSATGLGSGVIMSAAGHVLTNYHVIAEADQVIVALQDGRILAGEVIGFDVPTDLAVLKIAAERLPVIPQSEQLNTQVGDIVLAIGNPYNVGQTITQGIISATGRTGLSSMGPDSNGRQDLLQTDAAVNAGNSGGALVNVYGEMVGINTASFQSVAHQESYGISFAIPYGLARRIMEALIANGRVIRGYLGIGGADIPPVMARLLNLNDRTGIYVDNVSPSAPAAKAGIESGDVLLAIDGKPIGNTRHAMDMVAETRPGTEIRVTLLRDGKTLTLPVLIEEDRRFQRLR